MPRGVNVKNKMIKSDSMSTTDWIELSIHTSIHCILMITFLTLFYFFYVYPIEKATLEKTLKDLITKQVREILAIDNPFLLPEDQYMDKKIENLIAQQMNEIAIKAVEAEKNISKIRGRVMIFSFSLIGVITVILFLIYIFIFRITKRLKIHFHKIAYSVMYSILFVIVIEIFFFLTVTNKLQPVSSEQLQYLIYTNTQQMLKEYLNNHRTTSKPKFPILPSWPPGMLS
jgi:hypothetical protein